MSGYIVWHVEWMLPVLQLLRMSLAASVDALHQTHEMKHGNTWVMAAQRALYKQHGAADLPAC